MSDQDIKPLSEKKEEVQARIETLDSASMGPNAQGRVEDLREELEELEKHTPKSYRLTEEIFALRDDLERLDEQLGMGSSNGAVPHADEEDIEDLRDRRRELAEEIKSKQAELGVEAGKTISDASTSTAAEGVGR